MVLAASDVLVAQNIGFGIIAAVMIVAAIRVVTSANVVHAALSLVLVLAGAAAQYLLLAAEFVAVTQVLVYVGAVMVLFLFVVMMLDIQTVPSRGRMSSYLPVAIIVAVVMAFEMLALIGVGKGQSTLPADPALAAGMGNTEWIGRTLFTDYLLPFELAAVILTVAIIAAIMLTLRHRSGVKHQDPSRQVQVRKEDRIRIVKMAAQTEEKQP